MIFQKLIEHFKQLAAGLNATLNVPTAQVINVRRAGGQLRVGRHRIGCAGDPASGESNGQTAELIVGTGEKPITQRVGRAVRQTGDRLPDSGPLGGSPHAGHHVQAGPARMAHRSRNCRCGMIRGNDPVIRVQGRFKVPVTNQINSDAGTGSRDHADVVYEAVPRSVEVEIEVGAGPGRVRRTGCGELLPAGTEVRRNRLEGQILGDCFRRNLFIDISLGPDRSNALQFVRGCSVGQTVQNRAGEQTIGVHWHDLKSVKGVWRGVVRPSPVVKRLNVRGHDIGAVDHIGEVSGHVACRQQKVWVRQERRVQIRRAKDVIGLRAGIESELEVQFWPRRVNVGDGGRWWFVGTNDVTKRKGDGNSRQECQESVSSHKASHCWVITRHGKIAASVPSQEPFLCIHGGNKCLSERFIWSTKSWANRRVACLAMILAALC